MNETIVQNVETKLDAQILNFCKLGKSLPQKGKARCSLYEAPRPETPCALLNYPFTCAECVVRPLSAKSAAAAAGEA